MFKWFEWIYFLLCVAFCVYAFIDQEYLLGVLFTIVTIIGLLNTIRANLKEKEKK